MRILKAVIGWLCLLSLLVGLFFGGYWVYLESTPFFRGAKIVSFAWVDEPTGLMQQVASNGLDPLDVVPITEYATRGTDPYTRTGWDAAVEWLTDRPRVVKSQPTDIAAVALIDWSGAPVAVYPTRLARHVPRYEKSAPQGWIDAASSYLRERGTQTDHPSLFDVRNRVGYPIGTLIVIRKYDREFAVIPDRARVYGFIGIRQSATAAILLLVLFALLLPVWVAMDAGWRGMRPFAWGLLVLLTNWIGLLAYLLARLSPPGPCPNCGEQVLAKYKRCPVCGASLLSRCPVCKRKMKPGWQYCPICTGVPAGQVETQSSPEPSEPAPPPATEAAERDRPGVLKIHVLHAGTGAAVPGAIVLIKGPVTLQGLVGPSGCFEARKPRSGSYDISATRQGFETDSTRLDIDEGSGGEVWLNLKPLAGSIYGRVVESDAALPIAEARVYLDSGRLDRAAMTGRDGRFTLEDIPPGPYAVCAEAVDHEPQTRVAEVQPGARALLDFALQPPVPIRDVTPDSREATSDTK